MLAARGYETKRFGVGEDPVEDGAVGDAHDQRVLVAEIGLPWCCVAQPKGQRVAIVGSAERAAGDDATAAEFAAVGQAEQVAVEGGATGEVAHRQHGDGNTLHVVGAEGVVRADVHLESLTRDGGLRIGSRCRLLLLRRRTRLCSSRCSRWANANQGVRASDAAWTYCDVDGRLPASGSALTIR